MQAAAGWSFRDALEDWFFWRDVKPQGVREEQVTEVVTELGGLLEDIARLWDDVLRSRADRSSSDDMVYQFALFYKLSYLDRPKEYRRVLDLIYDGCLTKKEYENAVALSKSFRDVCGYSTMFAAAYGRPEEYVDLKKEHAKLSRYMEVLRKRLSYIDDTDLEGFRELISDAESAVRSFRRKLGRLIVLFRRVRAQEEEQSA